MFRSIPTMVSTLDHGFYPHQALCFPARPDFMAAVPPRGIWMPLRDRGNPRNPIGFSMADFPLGIIEIMC